jgi:hypothetical protein
MLDSYYGGHKRIVGGDFNLAWSPSVYLYQNWYVNYEEADEGDNEHTDGSAKFDYWFANSASYYRIGGNAVDSEGWSDHKHYYGTFQAR